MRVEEALARVVAAMPMGEERPEQAALARAVEVAITSKRHLLAQAGTGVGKCLHGDTLITLADGSRAPIRELVGRRVDVLAVDGELRARARRVVEIFPSGRKEVFKLRSRLGREIVASADHRLLTVLGWRRLGDLDPGDHVAALRRAPAVGRGMLKPGEAAFLGHMVAEGNCATSGPDSALTFTNFDEGVVDDWRESVRSLPNAVPTVTSRHGHYGVRRITMVGHERNGAHVLLERDGVLGRTAHTKRVPPSVFAAEPSVAAAFLGRLFSGDGSVEVRASVVSLSSASHGLLLDVQDLLLRFGVISRVREKRATCNGKVFPAWNLSILGAGPVRAFADAIGDDLVGAKHGRLRAVIDCLPAPNPNVDVLPAETWELVDKARGRAGLSWSDIRRGAMVASSRRRGISRRALLAIAELCDDLELHILATSDIYWDEVVSIEPWGDADTYDITMTGHPNFVANGFVVHNSMAYLIPAILSGQKVVVATATKALQEQLVHRDLPFLREHLGVPFTFSLLKGRSNYLCRAALADTVARHAQGELLDREGIGPSRLAEIVEWSIGSTSGDRADLPFTVSNPEWSSVSVAVTECPGGARCSYGDVCFSEDARLAAAESDVVVVNTHLYGIHLATDGAILPDHDVLILDEAHAFEDIAADTLGVTVGPGRVEHLARSCRGLFTADHPAIAALDSAATAYASVLEPLVGQRVDPRLDDVTNVLVRIGDAATKAASEARALDLGGEVAGRRDRLVAAAGHVASDVGVLANAGEGRVVWCERALGNQPVLRVAPVEVGTELRTRLFEERTVVLASATLSVGGRFEPVAAQLGIDEFESIDAGSPFDYASQSLLYCAAHLPGPRSPQFEAAMLDELDELVRAAGGRALVLFTSRRAMDAAAARLDDASLPFQLLVQDRQPRPVLHREFLEDETSVLLATMGFWQGFDAPGRTCSLVVIDKLPFARPDDPLAEARRQAATRARRNAFEAVDLPRAAILLAQGAGRLIRSTTDRGVVAVLDRRLATARYRWTLVNSLPPMARTKDPAVVRAFLADITTIAV